MTTPDAVTRWVIDALGSRPVAERFNLRQMSHVVGLRLADGREVVVKVRPDVDRARRCVAGQRALHADGFPCPEPLTAVAEVDGMAIHAESYVGGGEQLAGTDPTVVDRFATLLADLIDRLKRLDPPAPGAGPMWLTWDHDGADTWPQDPVTYPRLLEVAPAGWLTDLGARVRARLAAVRLTEVVGHGDWESQNLRWRRGRIHVVHDWDSLTPRPEAALVGAAAAAFATEGHPTLAPLHASERFVAVYERERGRSFTDEEREVAWATGLWLATHGARMELAEDRPPLMLDALAREADERLARARA